MDLATQLLTRIFKTFFVFFYFTHKSKNCTHIKQNASHLYQNEALHSKDHKHFSKTNISHSVSTFAIILHFWIYHTHTHKLFQNIKLFFHELVHLCTTWKEIGREMLRNSWPTKKHNQDT